MNCDHFLSLFCMLFKKAVMELACARENLHLQTKQMEDMLTRMRYLEAKVFRLEEDKKMRAARPFSMLVADVMSDEKEHQDHEGKTALPPEIDRLAYFARSTPSPRLQRDGTGHVTFSFNGCGSKLASFSCIFDSA
jgi:hypothetical protein